MNIYESIKSSLKEGSFGDEVGFAYDADIDAMEQEFNDKLSEYFGVDDAVARFNKFELHRGTSWTDSNPWMLVDIELNDEIVFKIVESDRNIAPIAYQLDSSNDLVVYSTGVEMGRTRGMGTYYGIESYTTFDVSGGWFNDNYKKDTVDKLTAEEQKVCDVINKTIKDHYNELLQIMLDNEYVDEDYEEMDESDDCNPAWFRNRALYREYKEFVDGQLRDGAIDDPDYIKELSDEEYEDLLVNTWMQDKGMQQAFSEIYGMPIDGSLKETDKPKKYSVDDFDTLEDAVKELQKVTGITDYFDDEEWDEINPDDVNTINYYIEDIVDNYLNVPSTHIKESEKTVLTKFDWEDGLEDFEYYTDENKDIYAKNKNSGRLYFCTGDGDPEQEIEDDSKFTFKEADEAAGMTLYDYIVNVCGGEIDEDVSDDDVDMMVAFSYDVNDNGGDYPEMQKFLETLAKKTKIVKKTDGTYPVLVCDFSSALKPYNEKWKEFFDMDNSEFDEDEAYYEAVANLEPLISGNAGESTYKEINDILNGKGLNESEGSLTFEEIDSKQVPDSDGFMTDYTMYKKPDGGYVFVFGDKELNNPEDAYYDWEEDNEEAAKEWFDSYNGFND